MWYVYFLQSTFPGEERGRMGEGGEKEGEKRAEDVFGDFTLVGAQADNINRTRIPKTNPRKKNLQTTCWIL
jgi:hypothetical protein